MTRRIELEVASHRYTVDGVPAQRSVTEILRPLHRFEHVPDYILDEARQRGTLVHQAVHYLFQHDLNERLFAEDYPMLVGYVAAAKAFRDSRRFASALNEHRVYSDRHDIAGTIDCLGVLDGHGALIDFATGRPQDAAKDLQTAGYLALALEWQAHDPALEAFLSAHKFVRRYALQLRRDGTFLVEAYADPRDIAQFLTLADAQRIVAARLRREVAEVA